MAEKRSRFEQIYRQKTQAGEGTFSAVGSTAKERLKERADLRRLFSDKGMFGAMLESALGKAYKYGEKGASKKGVDSEREPLIDNKQISIIRINTAITAKNSMVLPGMARDMNVMRQNIVRMTKATTGSAVTKADTHFLKSKQREIAYESSLDKMIAGKKESKVSTKKEESKGLFSSIFGGVGSILGGIGSVFKGGGSIIGGIFSGLSSIVGGVLGGVFRVASSVLGGYGLAGILLAILAGSLITSMYKGLDFGKYGKQFGEIFTFISKSLKSFFGIEDSENSENKPGFFRRVAEYLDDTFKTSNFTDGLNYVIKKWKEFSDEISFQISKLYNTIMINATAAFQAVGDIFMGIGKDIKSVFYKWLDDNTVGIYTMMGAVVGARFGLKGKALAVAIGAGTGYLAKQTDEDRQKAVQNIEKQIEGIKYSLSGIPEGQEVSSFNPSVTRKSLQADLKDAEERLAEKKQEIEDRKGSGELAPFEERFKKYKEQAKLSYPEPTRPTAVSFDDSNFDYMKYRELVGQKESGGKYNTDVGIGYVGKYGMGTSALEDLGLLKPGTHKKYGDKMGSAGIYHPDAWVEGMSLAKFLSSPQIQDDAMARLTEKIKKYEEKEGIITPGMSGTDIAERLYAQMHGNAKSLYQEGKVTEDFYFKGATNKQSAEWMHNMYAKGESGINKHTDAVNENTDALNKLNKQLEEEKTATMTQVLTALLEGISNSGTTVNNVNNTTVASADTASPYNDDMLAVFKNRAIQGF